MAEGMISSFRDPLDSRSMARAHGSTMPRGIRWCPGSQLPIRKVVVCAAVWPAQASASPAITKRSTFFIIVLPESL